MTKMFEVCYSGSWPELGTRPVLGLTDWWFGTQTIYYHFVLNTRVLSQFIFSLKALSFLPVTHSYLYGKFTGGHPGTEGRGAREEGARGGGEEPERSRYAKENRP